jgi:hypothetical protein
MTEIYKPLGRRRRKVLHAKKLISLVTSKPLRGERLPSVRNSFFDKETDFKYESTSPQVRDVIRHDSTKLPTEIQHNCSLLAKRICLTALLLRGLIRLNYLNDTPKLKLKLKFFLRPTDSRPVRLGIGPPFGTLDQILSCSSFFC